MKKIIWFYSTILLLLILLESCITASKVNYFNQSADQDSLVKVIRYNGPEFQIGDIIEVTILSNSKDVQELFPHLTSQGNRTNQTYLSGNPVQSGFTIDTMGLVQIPGVGRIKGYGKTKYQLQNEIVDSLSNSIIDPIVEVRLLNFKISILGDVKTPGSYQVPNDRITIFEAIAMCGDLSYSGNRKQIKLIRTIDGIKKEFIIDLTENNHFQKEYYYLKQNDIIFIPTTSVRLNQLNYAQYYLPAISSLSLIVTFLNLMK